MPIEFNVREHLPLKLVNVVAYLLFTGSNSYSHLGPGHGYGAGARETYLTPQSWIFGVQGLIHFFLLGMLFWQFTATGTPLVREALGVRFPVLCALNAAYAALATAHPDQEHGHFIYALMAFVAMVFVAGTVSHIYRTLKVHHPSKNAGDLIFVHLPFSLWHAFSVVLLFLSGFAAFGVDASHHRPGVVTKILVFVALLFLEATAAGYVFQKGEGDIVGALVISLSLLAIFQHQTIHHSGKIIHYSALAFFIISLVAVVKAVIAAFQGKRTIGGSDEERAPLVA